MLYFKQIEIGPMQNYVYLIGSAETRKVAVVDAAWEIDTILKIAAQEATMGIRRAAHTRVAVAIRRTAPL
jgi:hypothetical protein